MARASVLAAGGIYGYRYVQTKLHPANFTGAGHGTVDHVDPQSERGIRRARRPPTELGDLADVGERGVGQCVGRGVGNGAGHVGDEYEWGQARG